MSGGCLAFAGTDIQRAAGIEDTPESLFDDLREVGGFENDEALVRAYVDRQLEVFTWLRAHGVEFSPVLEAASGQSAPRAHNVDPADLVRLLSKRAHASGALDYRPNTPGRHLVRDAASKRVTGVETDDGVFLARKGVLLATGGFCNNGIVSIDLAARRVTVDDAAMALVRFEHGATGTIEASRVAPGRKNYNRFEINGSRGSVAFNLERMNELELYVAEGDARTRGFRTILSGPLHPPYDRLCPAPGHGIGFNDLKLIEIAHLLDAIAGKVKPYLTFEDGLHIERVIHAITRSSKTQQWTAVA